MLEIATQAAREAGRLLLDASRKDIRIESRSRRDVKLDMDRKAEETIISILLDAFPEHTVLSEERGRIGGDSEFLWVIDPLDGTYNYSRRLPVWCTSVGLLKNDEPVLGVIYDPVCDDLYAAEAGQGASLNGRPARVSDVESLDDATVCFSSGIGTRDLEKTMRAAAHLGIRAGKVRGMGAAATHTAYVGAGRADAFYDFGAKLWDVAAGVVIVREAGGHVTLRDRGENVLDIAVSNGRFHEDLLREIEW